MGELWRRLAGGKFEPRPATWKDWLVALAFALFASGFIYVGWRTGGGGGAERRTAALFSKVDAVRADAALTYGRYPPRDDGEIRSIAPRLLELVRDPCPSVREMACYALGRLGRRVESGVDRREVVAALIAAMDDREERVRLGALEAIGGACEGLGCREAVAPLTERARSRDRPTRFYAIGALGEVATTEDAEAIGELEGLHDHGNAHEQKAAHAALAAVRERHRAAPVQNQ